MRFGYITNGLRDHRLEDAFALLADLGYSGVGITLDVGHLDPLRATTADVIAVGAMLRRYDLEAVIETGARFVLDPRRKHAPTLISAEGRERRLDYLRRGLEIADTLGARALSFWSGARDPNLDVETSWRYLIEGIHALEVAARGTAVELAFEPEPGMFIGDLAAFRELRDRFPSPALRLTLDLGHLQCTEEPPHDRWIRELGGLLANVHVDDIRGREHRHLPLGEGDIDFAPLLAALDEVDYRGLCLVELSRDSHRAPAAAAESIAYLRAARR